MGVMARKRRGPTLLELIREPPPGGAFRSGPSAGASSEGGTRAAYSGKSPGSGGLSWWQMGSRTLRIPVGYVIVAVGLALVLTVVGYIVGYNRRDSIAKADEERARIANAQLDMVDPLNAPAGGGQATPTNQPTQPVNTRPPQQAAAPQQAASGGSQSTPPAGLERDPRVVGMNYWVIARQDPDEARRAAAFLMANGVSVAIVETRDDKVREIIASMGFEGSGTAPEAARLKARILELGRLYRVQEKGATDFTDMYARKYSGR